MNNLLVLAAESEPTTGWDVLLVLALFGGMALIFWVVTRD